MTRHLIHIGYPKAGSTFLQAWFERHPELRYEHGGLGGFRSVYELARPSDRTYKYYVTSSEVLSTPHESAGGVRLGGEPEADDPIKENQAAVCARLKSLYPESRILIVTRGFRGIIMSGYSQYVRAGGVEHLAGMCRALAARSANEGGDYYDFDYVIRLYAEAFGEESLVVLPYELLRDDRARFLAVLEEELGLSHFEINPGRVNESLSPEELYWYPLISRAALAAASRLGPARGRKIYRRYVGLTFHNRLRPLVRLLRVWRPGARITSEDFPSEVLRCCEGKATLLRDRPLYTPYAAEYLWESETGQDARAVARRPREREGHAAELSEELSD